MAKQKIKKYRTKEYKDFNNLKSLVKYLVKEKKGKKDRLALFIAIGLYTGLRFGDIQGITKSDLLNNTVILYEEKTNKRRQVYLSEGFYELINKIDLDKFHELLFLNEKTGNLYQYRYFLDDLKKHTFDYLRIPKKDMSFHVLRKSWARQYYELSQDKSRALIEISEILNHANVNLTRHYLSLNSEDYQCVLDLM